MGIAKHGGVEAVDERGWVREKGTKEVHVVLRSGLVSKVLKGVLIGKFLQHLVQLLGLDQCSIILLLKTIAFFLHITHFFILIFAFKKVVH